MSKLPRVSSRTGRGPSESISGRLEEVPLADFVRTLTNLRKTGKLSITRFRESGFVLFRAGRIVSAGSTSMREALGSLLISRSLITEGQLEEALAMQRASERGRRLGEILVEMGAIRGEVLRSLVRQQTEVVLNELLRWKQGRFEFEPTDIEARDELEAELSGLLLAEVASTEPTLSTDRMPAREQQRLSAGSEEVSAEPAMAPGPEDTALGPEMEEGALQGHVEPWEEESPLSVPSLRLEDFRALVDTDPEPVVVIDVTTRVLYANETFTKIVGRTEDELHGQEIVDTAHPDDASDLIEVVREVNRGGVPGENTVRLRKADGSWRRCHVMPSAFVSQAGDRCVVLRGLATGEIETRFDPLTGLLEFEPLLNRVERILERFRMGSETPLAVLFIGIDRFTLVNVQYGWAQGNNVLKAVADRLNMSLRPGDIMARAGGDRFCVVLEHLREVADAVRMAERVAGSLGESLQVGDDNVSLSVSIGIATSDGGYGRAEEMLDAAIAAMAGAKKRPGSVFELADSGGFSDAPLAEEEETAPEDPSVVARLARGRSVLRALSVAAGLIAVLTLALWLRPLLHPEVSVLETAVNTGAKALPQADPEELQRAIPAESEPVDPGPAVQPVPQAERGSSSAMSSLTLELQATEDVWVRVTIDGSRRLETTLRAGQRRTFEGTGSAELVIGNAGGMSVLWNGNDLGRLGRTGQVRRLSFTPTGVVPATSF
jgi:diguanylate cyclase (GGDEF)-like protein/PAS domain S-box-containing protein